MSEQLGYELANLLANHEMSEVLEILAEFCGVHSERQDDELSRQAYLKAMEQLFDTAKLLNRTALSD